MKLYFLDSFPTYAATTTGDLSNLVTALADPTTATNAAMLDRIAAKIPDFVQSDTGEPLEFYFYDNATNISSWSTNSNIAVAVGLGDMDPKLEDTFASAASLTVSSNARVATLDLNTTELREKLAREQALSIGPFIRPPRAICSLQVRKSTAGVTKTVALVPVGVSAGVLSVQPAPMSDLVYTATIPATSSSSGTAGQWTYDTDYFYLCVAANTWRRFSLNDWA